MSNVEIWKKVLRTYIEGTEGEIEESDIEAIRTIASEIGSAMWREEQEEKARIEEGKGLSAYVKESTSLLEGRQNEKQN